jgi:hypothetical protein
MWIWALLLSQLFLFSLAAHADACDNPAPPSPELRSSLLARIPVQYYGTAQSIVLQLSTDPRGSILPSAEEKNGSAFVLLPSEFPKVLCRLVTTEYMVLDRDSKFIPSPAAASEAARCLQGGGSEKVCLGRYADMLGAETSLTLLAKPQGRQVQDQGFLRGMTAAALMQIMLHEYAHLLLKHYRRIDHHQISRADAEFEADVFAIMNGVQEGEAESAMFYVFEPLAELENKAPALASSNYESTDCRASNVENIVSLAGLLPIMLVRASDLKERTVSQDQLREVIRDTLAKKRYLLNRDACSRITALPLQSAFSELHELAARIEPDLDLLFTPVEKMDPDRMNVLIRDLSSMSARFNYLGGVTARCASLIIRNWGFSRPLTPIVAQWEQGGNVGSGNSRMMSGDYGRLLLEEGLAILQERNDLKLQQRLENGDALLRRAVYYNPKLSEAWMNLTFIEMKRADCSAAAVSAQRATDTYTGTDDVKGMQTMVANLRTLAQDRAKCVSIAEGLHTYMGW